MHLRLPFLSKYFIQIKYRRNTWKFLNSIILVMVHIRLYNETLRSICEAKTLVTL
jgi:hypothetical protein